MTCIAYIHWSSQAQCKYAYFTWWAAGKGGNHWSSQGYYNDSCNHPSLAGVLCERLCIHNTKGCLLSTIANHRTHYMFFNQYKVFSDWTRWRRGDDVRIYTLFNQRMPCIHRKNARRSVNGGSDEQTTPCDYNAVGQLLDTWPGRLLLSLWWQQLLHWFAAFKGIFQVWDIHAWIGLSCTNVTIQ